MAKRKLYPDEAVVVEWMGAHYEVAPSPLTCLPWLLVDDVGCYFTVSLDEVKGVTKAGSQLIDLLPIECES
jgi:hypothetical protein